MCIFCKVFTHAIFFPFFFSLSLSFFTKVRRSVTFHKIQLNNYLKIFRGTGGEKSKKIFLNFVKTMFIDNDVNESLKKSFEFLQSWILYRNKIYIFLTSDQMRFTILLHLQHEYQHLFLTYFIKIRNLKRYKTATYFFHMCFIFKENVKFFFLDVLVYWIESCCFTVTKEKCLLKFIFT